MVRNLVALVIGLVLVSIFLLLSITRLIIPIFLIGLGVGIAYMISLTIVEGIEDLWRK